MVTDRQVSVNRMLRGIGNLAIDEEDLLVNLVDSSESASYPEF